MVAPDGLLFFLGTGVNWTGSEVFAFRHNWRSQLSELPEAAFMVRLSKIDECLIDN
jgi:hypothetical protein